MKTIQLKIQDLEKILAEAKKIKAVDNSCSSTIELLIEKESDTHTGSDTGSAWIKSSYSECDGYLLGNFGN